MPKRPAIKMGSRVTLRAVSDAIAGRRRWRLEWYPAGGRGKMRTRSIGARGERHTAAEAESAARGLIPSLELDSNETPRVVDVVTVSDLLEMWMGSQQLLEQSRAIQPSTYRTRLYAARHIAAGIGHIKSEQLSRGDVQQWIIDSNAAPSTMRLQIRILLQAWKWGQEAAIVGAPPPMPRLPRPRPVYSRHTPSPDEAEATLRSLTHLKHQGAYQLIWGTGARVSEAASARPDYRAGTIRITGKTGPRTLPISPRARAGLDQLRSAGIIRPPLLSPPVLRQAIYKACDRAGIQRHSPHGLRRLAVDEMRRAGVPLEIAAQLLGHSVPVMLEIYRQPSAAEIAEAMRSAPIGGTVLQGPWRQEG